MTNEELLAAIDDLRNELAEARRYVRTKPASTETAITRFCHNLQDLRGHSLPVEDHAYRWAFNLYMGRLCTAAAPHVLEGYIDGTSWEIAWIKGQIEAKDTGRAGDR